MFGSIFFTPWHITCFFVIVEMWLGCVKCTVTLFYPILTVMHNPMLLKGELAKGVPKLKGWCWPKFSVMPNQTTFYFLFV